MSKVHLIKLSALLLIALLLMASTPACLALSCRQGGPYQSAQGNIIDTVSIPGQVQVPAGNLTRGKLLWRSDQQTVQFTCYDTDPTPQTAGGEDAYLYVDPQHQLANIDPRIVVGFTYNGVDYSMIDNNSGRIDLGKATEGQRATTLFGTTQLCTTRSNGNVSVCLHPTPRFSPFTLQFSIFVKASGNDAGVGSGQSVNATGNYDVFQLDGQGGLNSRPNSNFNTYINGLSNITFISCNPKIIVTANNGDYVDFGILSAQFANVGSIAKTIPFTVLADTSSQTAGQDCPNLTLKASFSTSQQVTNNGTTIMPVMDESGQSATGFGITIADDQNPGTPIQMNTTIPFGVVNGNQVTHKFDASLKWLNNQPETGRFHADANIDVTFQ